MPEVLLDKLRLLTLRRDAPREGDLETGIVALITGAEPYHVRLVDSVCTLGTDHSHYSDRKLRRQVGEKWGNKKLEKESTN